MRSSEFLVEKKQKKFKESPFPQSQYQKVVYHGTANKFKRFNRETHGVFVSRYKGYAEAIYGKSLPLYIDVRKIFDGGYDHPAVNAAFDADYKVLSQELVKLQKQGYDAVEMGGDGDSLILFGDFRIARADTGAEM